MTPDSKPLPVAPRYRAILHDPADLHAERPVQIYGNDWQEIEKWAETVLAKAQSPNAVVCAFETLEQFCELFAKQP
jgi:hypothetical protein